MTKLFLSVITGHATTTEVRVQRDPRRLPRSAGLLRISPIFSIASGGALPQVSRGSTDIHIGYSPDPFKVVAAARRTLPSSELLRIYVSHGLPSVIAFPLNPQQSEALHQFLTSTTDGVETWRTVDGRITEISSTLRRCSPVDVRIDLPHSLLDVADVILISEIESSFSLATALSQSYLPALQPLIAELIVTVDDLILRIAALRAPHDQWVRKALAGLPREERQLISAEIRDAHKDEASTARQLFQLRDELVQVAAISKTMNAHAFGGLPSVLTGPFETGDFSLLGLGGTFGGVFRMYEHIRNIFAQFMVDDVVYTRFRKLPAPFLPADPRPRQALKWRSDLLQYDGVGSFKRKTPGSSAPHMLYFSQRLGFRETKLSISAAYLGMRLGVLPAWSIFTLTHELLHAHVRSLFSILLPSDEQQLSAAYAVYRQRLHAVRPPRNLLVFFQALSLDLVHRLTDLEDNATPSGVTFERFMSKDDIYRGLRQHEELINEIAVHILDFTYFYESDADLYLKSIWSLSPPQRFC